MALINLLFLSLSLSLSLFPSGDIYPVEIITPLAAPRIVAKRCLRRKRASGRESFARACLALDGARRVDVQIEANFGTAGNYPRLNFNLISRFSSS
jgi:hypothetical protein